jgi:dipeptidyl aminopeptidase/acylaminoacyl peptidase
MFVTHARCACGLLIAVLTACGSDDIGPGGQLGLQLTTTTTGTQPDDDGYTIMVDGSAHGTIGPNDHVDLTDIAPGDHTVELSQIQFNCATLGAFTRPVTLSGSSGASLDYDVQCDAQSRSRIAYSSPSDSVADVEVIVANADGSDPESLTDLVGAIRLRDTQQAVSWSGSGELMAFTRSDGALYMANADGTGATQVAPEGFSPSWSRDGRKLAFRVHEPSGDPCCPTSNVYVAEIGAGQPVKVTHEPLLVVYDFARSGDIVAFEYDVTSKVSTVHADVTGLTPLTGQNVCCLQHPSLSPDGSMVAYYAFDETGDLNTTGYDIFVSPTDGSSPPVDITHADGQDFAPVWSPDGSRIAYINSPDNLFAQGSLYVVDADGSHRTNLTPNDSATDPTWSPDGTRIAYTGYISGEPHVYVANADGSGRQDITSGRPSSRPTWTGR